MPLTPGTRLGTYEILAPLGAGGMGEVYRARDRKLDRDVAVKVLPQTVAKDADSLARFEREAKAVAALSHPNILAIFDFGTQDGVAYAVTELLEGETLRGKIDAGAVSQRQAVDWALQVARGLSAAHERGVVHRDLKPENVFVTKDGHVKILDFGLAKRVEAASPDGQTSAPTGSGRTEPGTVMGTMGYMSPEQLTGQPVDHRTDLFSLGAILYELLSGRKAFKKTTGAETIAAVLKEEPPELTQSGRNVSPALDHIVRHCLEKDRDQRFQSARDIVFNLSEVSGAAPAATGVRLAAPSSRSRMLAIAAAVLLVLAASVFLARRSRPTEAAAAGVKRVAVLPFENQGAPEDDYFADGISDEVRAKLTSVPGLQVIARGSSTPYKKTTKTPKQIAQELDATYLLTATVRWEKGGGTSRVHVTPELVEVSGSGAPASKWQQPFDAALTNVFQVQSEIASKVAQALGRALGAGEEKKLAEKPTQNLAAYDAFLKGEDVSKGLAVGDPPSLRKALALYEEAVAIDPAFAQAWARVSMASALIYGNSTPTPELAERAREAGEKAVALAPERYEGYLALGNYYLLTASDSGRAIQQYEKGQRLAPTSAELLTWTARAEQALGRMDAAVEHLKQADRFDPRSVVTLRRLGVALFYLRNYAEARDTFDRALALAPASLDLLELKAMTFLAQGDLAAARATLKANVEPTALVAHIAAFNDLVWVLDDEQRQLLVRLTPSAFDDDKGVWGLCLTQAYALAGDSVDARTHAEGARKALEEQATVTPNDGTVRAELGLSLAYLGRKEEATREGRRSVELLPVTRDAYTGAYIQHQLVRIYILTGEPEKALDQLEPLLKIPYFLSPAWLKIDPNFDPLRSNPRFQRLVAQTK